MELHLCPSCSSFIRRDWTTCSTCGAELPELPESVLVQKPASPASDPTEPNGSAEPSGQTEQSGNSGETPASTPPPQDQSPETKAGQAQAQTDSAPKPKIPELITIEESDDDVTVRIPGRVLLTVVGFIVLILGVAATGLNVQAQDQQDQESAAAAENQFQQWQTYDGPNDRFSVRMPTGPARTDGSLDGQPVATLTSETVDSSAAVSVSTIELREGTDWSNSAGFLQTLLEQSRSQLNATVDISDVDRTKQHWQIDATMSADGDKINFRAFAADGYGYVLTARNFDGPTNPQLFGEFADSFRFHG